MNKSFNLQDLVRANVAAMQPYSSARDEFTDFKQEMVFLDANENPYNSDVNRYPDPQQKDLKSLIASQRKLSEGNLLLGNGSDEVLDLLFRAFCNPGKDAIITVPPTYGMYKVLAGTNDVTNHEVTLTKDFTLNLKGIYQVMNEHTKLIFICSPNNPTGNTIPEDQITELLEKFEGLVIVDEAYIDFAESSSWSKRLDRHPNLVITQTLSKAYGLAGIRLGICIASEEIISILNKIKPPYNVNALTQQRAYDRLVNLNKVTEEVQRILANRNELLRVLNKIPFITKVYPSEANFILARVDDAHKRYDQLLERGIVVRNRSSQVLCENTLRFTVGTTLENTKLIKALKTIV